MLFAVNLDHDALIAGLQEQEVYPLPQQDAGLAVAFFAGEGIVVEVHLRQRNGLVIATRLAIAITLGPGEDLLRRRCQGFAQAPVELAADFGIILACQWQVMYLLRSGYLEKYSIPIFQGEMWIPLMEWYIFTEAGIDFVQRWMQARPLESPGNDC
jgi:hypothetical protein